MVSVLTREDSAGVNSYTANTQADPRSATLADGSYVVVWNSYLSGDWDIYGKLFAADGSPTGGDFLINSTTATNQQVPFVAALKGGGFVVVWESYLQDGSSEGVYSQRYDALGRKVGDETLVNTTTKDHQEYADVAGLSDGGYVVVWESYLQDPDGSSGIYAQRYDSDGAQVGGETRINSLTDHDQNFPAVTALNHGGYVVTWTSRTDDGYVQSYMRLFGANGVAMGTDIAIGSASSDTLTNPDVSATTDGGFVVTWAEIHLAAGTSNLYVQTFDGSGAATRAIKLVAAVQPPAGAEEGGYYGHNSVAGTSDGGFVVAYERHDTVHGLYGVDIQRFDSTGENLGGELLVQAYGVDPGQDFRPSVTGLPDGGFAVTWNSQGEDGDGWGIRQQVFTASTGVTGASYLYGTGSIDTLTGTTGDDHMYGGAGNDVLLGGKGNDVLDAGSGNDRLDGGTGADTLTGGAGDDTYIVGSGDTVVEAAGGGIDTVLSSVTATLSADVENLTLTGSAALDGTGNTLDNIITGNSGANVLLGGKGNDHLYGGDGGDRLDGGTGTDILEGGDGNDTYIAGSGDTVVETPDGGVDTVETALANYTLGAHLENLTLAGTGSSNGTGNDLNNILTGNAGNNALLGGKGDDRLDGGGGNDWLDGGSGADTMAGGAGDDTYVVGSGDTIIEAANSGIDTVLSNIAYYHLGSTLENVTLLGAAARDADGNNLDNVMTGNGLNNHLNGGNGNDHLYGLDGADTLQGWYGDDVLDGGDGDDLITGGTGLDLMSGGAGNDTFVFSGMVDMRREAYYDPYDTITDLSAGDKVDLHLIDADLSTAGDQAFHQVAAFTHHVGELVLTYDATNNVTVLALDVRGSGFAEATMWIAGDHTGSLDWLIL